MTSSQRQYSPLERQGVNAIERHILGYNWIFREQPVSDFGIDAEIEICDDAVPTGRLIKLQIKSGLSWFRERQDQGVVFRGSSSHFKYWLGHSLPVVLVLYDPSSEQAWWVPVERNRVARTGQGCKIVVPNDHQLSPHSAKSLRALALGRSYEDDRLSAESPVYVLPDALTHSIGAAKKSIDIATPQLGEYLRSITFDSVSRGVRIRLILGESDRARDLLLRYAAQGGGDIAVRIINNVHLKQVVVDNEIAIYGSTVDPTVHRPEAMYLVKDPRLVRSMSEAFEHAWSISVEI
jgi:phosphatidylserine/phosphatidylglycerophosphate/cardiolipin synthase-like enzyme